MEPDSQHTPDQSSKKRKRDAGNEKGGGGGGEKVDKSEAPGTIPLPLSLNQFARKVEKYTLKFSGTTFVGSATDGTNENQWYNFPWEFYKLFIAPNQVQEIIQKYRYWKGISIKIQFKNPICIQDMSASTTGVVSAGMNLHTQLYTYLDDMYLMGPASKPAPSNDDTFSYAELDVLQASWKKNGLNAGAAVKLPFQDISYNLFSSTSPDVEAIGMGPGQGVTHGWHMPSPYWRSTGELLVPSRQKTNTTTSVTMEAFGRWDEMLGYTITIRPEDDAPTLHMSIIEQAACFNTRPEDGPGKYWTNSRNDAGLKKVLPHIIPFATPEPIPRIYLQLQPQLGSIDAGVSNSICQLQYEMEVVIACTGRVPREQSVYNPGHAPTSGQFGSGAESINMAPIWKPMYSNYDVDQSPA